MYVAAFFGLGRDPVAHVRTLFASPDDPAGVVLPIGIFRDDPRLGYTHVPLRSGRHKKAEFDVTYSIDAASCRVTPDPLEARGSVLVLGDSFTFGHGVADIEAYPAVLGASYWRTYKVRNCAGMGWGTGQAALLVDGALATSSRPTAIVYAWIWPNSQRNYLRRSWLTLQNQFKRRNVHFELVGGRLRYEGTAGPELAIDDHAAGLPDKERALTLALVQHMATAASRASVRFHVVLLPWGDPAAPAAIDDDLVDFMRRHGIVFVDLRRLESKRSAGPLGLDRTAFFPVDGHPTPTWHATVAAALANHISLR
ncbi:MAG: hypothetical protein ACREKH_00500 [Candidatus Rokuibacteriota bacterium]